MATTGTRTATWSYADERGRPFVDLLPGSVRRRRAAVVDLGCGPGNLTALLAARWPGADVLGVDSSPEMVDRARPAASTASGSRAGDVRTWADPRTGRRAVGQRDLPVGARTSRPASRAGRARRAGRLVRLPGPRQPRGAQPRPAARLAADARFARHTEEVARPHSHDPGVYAGVLRDLGLVVDAWETTYLHLLGGEDPVFTWISGTGARPMLQSLPDDLREDFVVEYKALLRSAYPPGRHGTVLPFRRVFVVAHR